MSIANLPRLGQDKLTGDALATFYEVFSGEVLAAYDKTRKLAGRIRSRRIESGKGADFFVTGRADTKYLTPGHNLLADNDGTSYGSKIAQTKVTINIDGLMTASTFIFDLDDAMNHYDARSVYAEELGRALANKEEQTILQVGVLAAREAANLAELPGGTVLEKGATVESDAPTLASAIFEASDRMDDNFVPEEGRFVIVRPSEYSLLIQGLDAINKDWGGRGSYADGNILRLGGVDVIKHPLLPSTSVSAETGSRNTYDGDFTDTVGVVMHRDAIGTVELKDVATEMEWKSEYQGWFTVGKYAKGFGILRPECAVEISKADASS